MKTPNHDIAPGRLTGCQVCGSTRLEPVIDLGHQALSDSLLTRSQLDEPEVTYPSRFVRCVDCSLGQLDYVVEPQTVFHPDYPYRTGADTVKGLQEYGFGLKDLKAIGRDNAVRLMPRLGAS